MNNYLKKHGLDLVAAFWLLVVFVQYLSSYFTGWGLDLKPVYYAMLAFTTGVVAYRIYTSVRACPGAVHDQSPVEEVRAGGRKTRRSRR